LYNGVTLHAELIKVPTLRKIAMKLIDRLDWFKMQVTILFEVNAIDENWTPE
jgi:hypothetical protein